MKLGLGKTKLPHLVVSDSHELLAVNGREVLIDLCQDPAPVELKVLHGYGRNESLSRGC